MGYNIVYCRTARRKQWESQRNERKMNNNEPSNLHVHIEQSTLDILLAEYNNLYQQIDNSTAQLTSMITILITAIAAVLGTDLNRKIADIHLLALFPVTAMVIGGIILHLFVRWSTFSLQTRLVSARIIKMTGQPPTDLYFHRDSAAARFQSLRKSSYYKNLVYTLFIMVIGLIIVLNISFVARIYHEDHLFGFIFGLLIIIAMLIALLAIYSMLVDLPKMYDRILESGESGEISTRQKPARTVKKVSLLFPRASDFISKSWLFLFGVLASIWTSGLTYFHPRIHDLFTNQPPGSSLPVWMIFAFAVCWYLIQELIIQQAKYSWNDLRDRERDLKTGGKQDRSFVGSDYNPQFMAFFITLRFAVGILLGYLLDSRLGTLLLVIVVTQVFYELFVKPHAARYPLLATIIIALGSTFRFVSGALSVSERLNLPIMILAAAFFFLGVGYIAKYWKVEAEHCLANQREYPPRPQSDFFLQHGRDWQHFGFVGMLVTAIFLWTTRLFLPGLNEWLAARMQAINLLIPDPFWNVFLFVLIVLAASAITLPLYRAVARFTLWMGMVPLRSALLLAILILVPVGMALVSPQFQNLSHWIGSGLVLTSFLSILTYENMGYEAYLLVPLQKNLKYIGLLWYVYFFKANTNLTFQNLMGLSFMMMGQDMEQIKAYLAKKGFEPGDLFPS